MITTTLNKIQEAGFRGVTWKNLLIGFNKTEADDDRIAFKSILKIGGISGAIFALGTVDPMVKGLFAVACAQDVVHLMKNQRSVNAVKTSHLYLHGEATSEDLSLSESYINNCDPSDYADYTAFCLVGAIKNLNKNLCISFTASNSFKALRGDIFKVNNGKQAEHLIAITDNFEGGI